MVTSRRVLFETFLVLALLTNSAEALDWHLPSFHSAFSWDWPWRAASSKGNGKGNTSPPTAAGAQLGSVAVAPPAPTAAAAPAPSLAAAAAAAVLTLHSAATAQDPTAARPSAARPRQEPPAASDVRLHRMEASVEKEESMLRNEDSLLANLTKRHKFLASRTKYLKERIHAQQLKLEIDKQLPGARNPIHGLPAVVVDRGASFQLVASGDWANQVEGNLRAMTLAATIGLKATLPVLTVEFGVLFVKDFPYQFSKDFAWMDSIAALCITMFFVLVEVVADAIPVLDEFVDMVMAVLKPLVAAFVTIAMQNENTTSVQLTVICAAAFLAAGVAAAKQASTMMLDVATGGSGAPFRSVFESILSACFALAGLYSDVAAFLIVIMFISISLAVCFSARTRDSPKSGPYLASLCLWPEPVIEAPQVVKMPRIP